MAQTKLHSSPFSARNSPRNRRLDESPSRQLQFELDRAFSQIQLQECERQKVYAYQRRQQQEELDAKELAQAEAHRTELSLANAQHEVVRLQAEAVLQAYLKKEEEDRRRREEERKRQEEEERKRREEEEARIRAEQERREREERERKEREERAKAEAQRQALYEKQKAEAEEKRRQEKEAEERKQQEEKLKAHQEAALRQQEAEKAAAAAAAASAAATAAASKTQLTAATTPQIPPGKASPNIEAIHQNYLGIHKKLKVFRKQFTENVKKDPNLKPHVGDMRRAMRTSVGQLTEDKVGNRKAHDRVRTTLQKALKELPSPMVPVNDFLPSHLSLNDDGATTVPSLVVYLLSIFSKAIINAFVGECAVNPKAAEPIGTLVAQIFSMAELQFPRKLPTTSGTSNLSPTESLISILMCKFHASAPILFGIYGSETTNAGKLRLGWRLESVSDDKKAFVTENKHYDRQTGLGVGYASIALRNFSRAKMSNPWPPTHFWSSLALIVNTPPSEVQISHLTLLKNMLENNAVERFVLFFGAAGVAALRQAVVEFPRKWSRELQEKPIAKAMALMVESWATEKHFRLD